jgi:hypothetical protein
MYNAPGRKKILNGDEIADFLDEISRFVPLPSGWTLTKSDCGLEYAGQGRRIAVRVTLDAVGGIESASSVELNLGSEAASLKFAVEEIYEIIIAARSFMLM